MPHPVVSQWTSSVPVVEASACLDVGCGRGRHSALAVTAGYEVEALDLATFPPYSLREAVRFRVVSAPFLSLRRKYALIYCIGVLHHLMWMDARRTLNQLVHSLDANGRIIYNLHSIRDSKYGKGRLVERNTYQCSSGRDVGQCHRFYSHLELRLGLSDLRVLRAVHWQKNGYAAYYVMASKEGSDC